ncbi:hypothetical protein HYT92_02840 [Candidatus Pacearchaeota archaeon]|nr:hypothetical protein [Candidatus Pacearchaeota archaeon]
MPEKTICYAAEDGLNVLDYLGLTNITGKEKEVFREKWDEIYKNKDKDFIGAVWELYAEALPFICGDGDRNSFMVAQLRDSDFGKRLETTKLDDDLKQGIPLEDIFKKGAHKFLIRVKI